MKKIFVLILSIILVVAIFECTKKEKDTTATIKVVDKNGNPLVGMKVRVFCPSNTCDAGTLNSNMDKTGTSNGAGEVFFDYTEEFKLGQSGFAILDIYINGGIATGVIKIEEEMQNSETVTCLACF